MNSNNSPASSRIFRFTRSRRRAAAIAILQVLGLLTLLGSTPAWPKGTAHESLGTVSFPIGCSPGVQKEFERAVALLHHMMYVESRKTFEAVAERDPDCAMAQWGIAMTLFQPLWPTRPGPLELERGRKAVEKAKALAPASDRERAYISAVEAFFRDPSTDYWTRIHRFEVSMEAVHRAFPRDQEAAAFYALAHLATAAESDTPRAHNERAADILLDIIDREPTHPGAVHYTIHANDVEGRAGESIEIVRSYDNIAPSVPHALHMPTHIFVRLGLWEDVIHWNTKSAEAALNFPAGDATSHHYPHAIDYLIYARLQRGEDAAARELIDELLLRGNYQQTFMSAYHLAAIPARYQIEQGHWTAAAALPERSPAGFPWQRFPWPEAVTQFARGIGAARSGDVAGASAAVEKLEGLKQKAREAGEEYFAQQIEISRLAVAAWHARAEGRDEEAVRLMRASAEIEASTEKHPVTPGAIKPSFELLGDLYQELGRWQEALSSYQIALERAPGRLNSLLGAARAAAAAGDQRQATAYYTEARELAGHGSQWPAEAEFTAF